MNPHAARRERGALLVQWQAAGWTLVQMRAEAQARGWSSYTKERIRQVLAAERKRREEGDSARDDRNGC